MDAGGHVMKACELLALQFGFRVGEDFRVERLFELEQMPEDARQFCGSGPDGERECWDRDSLRRGRLML
jgi:hypothetical protein